MLCQEQHRKYARAIFNPVFQSSATSFADSAKMDLVSCKHGRNKICTEHRAGPSSALGRDGSLNFPESGCVIEPPRSESSCQPWFTWVSPSPPLLEHSHPYFCSSLTGESSNEEFSKSLKKGLFSTGSLWSCWSPGTSRSSWSTCESFGLVLLCAMLLIEDGFLKV